MPSVLDAAAVAPVPTTPAMRTGRGEETGPLCVLALLHMAQTQTVLPGGVSVGKLMVSTLRELLPWKNPLRRVGGRLVADERHHAGERDALGPPAPRRGPPRRRAAPSA